MRLANIGVDGEAKALIPHVEVGSTALGVRDKPEGRPLPKPTATLEGFQQYLQRAHAIGYEPDGYAVTFEKLKLVVAQKNILVYDSWAVHNWMNKKTQEEGKRLNRALTWVWKPLTKNMKKIAGRLLFSYQHLQWATIGRDSFHMGAISNEMSYTKIIPEAVLATAETIIKEFTEKEPVCLFVSDYGVVQPDPFLAVAVPSHPFLIVDFWDEPGFQPKAADTNTQKGLNE